MAVEKQESLVTQLLPIVVALAMIATPVLIFAAY